ncbi:hypothetical protein HYPSUDRAFT_595561 [Hypholoma sublateritium FD-334 SS-4]|uniref:Uncharacterized protein n=1 Tax=Hypholoma sublateritium (strain FD-334 SS-4) TaxID=945553 RepID=A0A0D2MI06_HYPSF|nr:hypothetical protein HYPSUDRAFT_595561 [Hypholoma sublateritium FD-334 SS-4]
MRHMQATGTYLRTFAPSADFNDSMSNQHGICSAHHSIGLNQAAPLPTHRSLQLPSYQRTSLSSSGSVLDAYHQHYSATRGRRRRGTKNQLTRNDHRTIALRHLTQPPRLCVEILIVGKFTRNNFCRRS